VAQKVGTGIALLFHDRGTRRGEWSAARPGCNLPPGKTRYPFYSYYWTDSKIVVFVNKIAPLESDFKRGFDQMISSRRKLM